MSTDNNPKLRSVKVEYIKGKYSYKQRMNILSDQQTKYHIEFSGPIDSFQKDQIASLLCTMLREEEEDLIRNPEMSLKVSR